jgi:hypothetical protein
VPSGLSGVTAVAAGHVHSLALKGDGTVVAWGCGGGTDWGQCSVPGGVTAIAAGASHSLALRSDGTVVASGCGDPGGNYGQCSVPSGLTGVTAIAAGQSHSLALKGDGTVVAWGCAVNPFGECSVPGGLSGVIAVAAGPFHSLALVELMNQTITFRALANKTYGARDFNVSATASSGLAVSFAAKGRCAVSGKTVHLTGVGSCTVTASQPGDANYNPAPKVSRTFSIRPVRCIVPKVVGKRLAPAKRAIAKKHCRTGKVRYADSRRRRGVVVKQSRRPGKVLPARSKIDLVISRGRKR